MGKKELSEVDKKKHTMRVYRTLTLIFFLLCLAAPVGVLVFTFLTINSTTVLPDNHTILYGAIDPKYSSPCSDIAILDKYRPLRFAFGNETEAVSCTWPVLNTVFHFILSFAAIGFVITAFIFSFPRRGPLLYLFAIIIACIGVGFGYSGYDDSSDIAVSNKWCRNGLKDMPWVGKPPKDTFDCRYSPFILLTVLDFVSALVCILLSFFAICFVCRAGPVVRGKSRKDGLLKEEEEEETNDPFEKLAKKDKDPRDKFGEPEEEDVPKSEKKKSGGFFSRFGGGKKNPPPATATPEGSVNFEQESSNRFAPMSRTDREGSSKPLGRAGDTPDGGSVGNALFNFDDVPSSDSKQQSKPAQEQPKPQPAAQQPKPQQPKPQPAPKQSSGMIDFESLAGADDDNPFASN